jgi:hypothetical protein
MSPMGPKTFAKNLMLLSSDFFSIRHLGFNPGLYPFTAKLKHRTQMVFCLEKAKVFFYKKSDQIFQFLGTWVSTKDTGQEFFTPDFVCKSDPRAGELQI